MELTGGTPEALALIKKLKLSGNLIDVYDRERIRSEKTPSLVTLEMMDEFDQEFGIDYHHHLLAIFVDDGVRAKELINIFPDFEEKFNDEVFKPTLILINLASKQIASLTRVRGGNIVFDFIPHSSGIRNLNSFDRTFFIDSKSEERFKIFIDLDYADVISELSGALERISYSDYNMVYREIDSGHIQEMLRSGPNKLGLYCKNSSDEDGLTREELDDQISQITDFEESLADGIEVFANFFPKRSINFENFYRND